MKRYSLTDVYSQKKEITSSSDFERRIYDLEQLLDISRSLCSAIEFPKLVESIIYTCMGLFRVLWAEMFLQGTGDNDYFRLSSVCNEYDSDDDIDYRIPVNSEFAKCISCDGETVYTMDELEKILPDSREVEIFKSLHPSLVVPLINKTHLEGFLLLGERIAITGDDYYTDSEKALLISISSFVAVAVTNAILLELSSTDMMTHLKLKHYFFGILTNKIDEAVVRKVPISVLMFDIDFFKHFNDTYGHSCGDYVLKTVAMLIKSEIRAMDVAARYGGEEFVILLNKAGRDEALIVAERIRKRIESYDFCYEGKHVNVTISGGVAYFDRDANFISSSKAFVDQADYAMYISKRSGRNKITVADPGSVIDFKQE